MREENIKVYFISLLVIATLVFAITGWGNDTTPKISPGPSTIRITTTQTSFQSYGPIIVRLSKVYNKPTYRGAFGKRNEVCIRTNSSLAWCHDIVALPQGQLVLDGLVVNRTFYPLSVTGGTGAYSNTTGDGVVQHLGPSTDLIIINLIGIQP